MTELITIADYLQEYHKTTQQIRETDNSRTRKQLSAYARRLAREIKEFDRNRGTNYGRGIVTV